MTRNPRRVSMYLEEVSVAARPALSATRKAFRYLARQQFCALICGVETAPTGVLHNNFLPWHYVCTEPTIPTITMVTHMILPQIVELSIQKKVP